MPRPRLEVFEVGSPPPGAAEAARSAVAALEEVRHSGYEQGYQAGWDDAVTAQTEDQQRISAELSRSIQALSLTWQEARGHILTALEPLLRAITERLLPEIARETLAPLVLETLMPLAEGQADQPATVLLHPVDRARIEAVLRPVAGLPLVLREEPSLSEGQVYLRLGPAEATVDLTRVTAEIAAALHAFFTLEQESRKDGRPD